MKVHKITVLVIDLDDLGKEAIKGEMESIRYPNHCMNPSVMDIVTVDVDWDDDHPLNKRSSKIEELRRLFDE